ncbi:hypothetical protein PsorP6_004614 [Peronosclerospora sorghi]|uniref:Uncharacterized protein n=1 Tax=Peronosclerospora sorghi TaxID=230839 RepID=A0ACC0VM28_9STRA|nr:hypothetical protein PsorP6_004614 [Peronosclerospora sorghi]
MGDSVDALEPGPSKRKGRDHYGKCSRKTLIPNEECQANVATVSYYQSSIKAFTLPRLKGSEQKMIENNLAIYYYITGSSFQKIEEQHLIEAFKIARPDVQLPSRKQLA